MSFTHIDGGRFSPIGSGKPVNPLEGAISESNEELSKAIEGQVPERTSSTGSLNAQPRTPFFSTQMLFPIKRVFINLFLSTSLKEPSSSKSEATTGSSPTERSDTPSSLELSTFTPSNRSRSSSIESQESSRPFSMSSQTSANSSKASAQAFYDFSTFSENKKITLTHENEKLLGASQDQGGHGGTLKGPLEINGKTEQVFLKPFDGVEAKNYELIQEHAPDLAKFMPQVHGLATDTKGSKFLIMENTRLALDEQGQPKALEQYGDIKIAGKIPGLDNLICDQSEMQTTRGKSKGFLDYTQMKKGAEQAPGFMFYKDSAFLGKAGRLLNFKNSESNLHEKLMTAKPDKEVLGKLITELRSLKLALEKSPIALIGGSIIIVEDGNGGLKPKLIDPAHVQYNPELKDKIEGDQTHLYFGDEKTFENRKLSNIQGLNNLCNALENLRAKLKD